MDFLRRAENSDDIPLAPMIDIVFQLLIFFMVASSFIIAESHLNVNLPATTAAEATGEFPVELVIEILPQGTVLVNGRQYDDAASKNLPELTSMLSVLQGSFEDQPVIISAAWDVPHERVIEVLNACAAARVKSVSFLVPEEQIREIAG